MLNKVDELIKIKAQGNEKEFALQTGIKQQTLNNYTTGKRGISLDAVMSILSAYPDVSAEWLLRGKGEMILSDNLPPIIGDESENDLDTHVMLAHARKELDVLVQEIASFKEKITKQAGVIEWQKGFITELMDEKKELERQLPQASKKAIV